MEAATIARLDALRMSDLFTVARRAGLTGDFNRLYSPTVTGRPMRESIYMALDGRDLTAALAAVPAGADKPARAAVARASGASNAGDMLAALADIIKAGIGEDRLRALIDERLAELAPRVIEVHNCDHVAVIDEPTHAVFDDVLKTVSTRAFGKRLHAWLSGPSGSGKSHIAQQVARALGLGYQTTGAIDTPFQLIGFRSPSGDESTLMTPFRRAFENGDVFCWDDVDASNARALVPFNEALSNGVFAFPDRLVRAHPDFVCIATANTWGGGSTADFVGRCKLDGATLTRFVKISVDYDERLERALAGAEGGAWCERVQSVRRAVRKLGLRILVTPRTTIQGAALLMAGLPQKRVEQMTLFAGLDTDTVSKIEAAL